MESMQNQNLSSSNTMSSDSKNKMNSAPSKMVSVAHRIEDKISDQASHLVEKAQGYLSESRHYVQENPVKSVAIAAASGLALGGLISLFVRSK